GRPLKWSPCRWVISTASSREKESPASSAASCAPSPQSHRTHAPSAAIARAEAPRDRVGRPADVPSGTTWIRKLEVSGLGGASLAAPALSSPVALTRRAPAPRRAARTGARLLLRGAPAGPRERQRPPRPNRAARATGPAGARRNAPPPRTAPRARSPFLHPGGAGRAPGPADAPPA